MTVRNRPARELCGSVDLVGDGRLVEVLEQGRAFGYLGPGPVIDNARHALAFGLVPTQVPKRAVDLGSGGGIPGLVLARHVWPRCRWHLLEASGRRCDFLRGAVRALDLGERVSVEQGRAEELSRHPGLRHAADLVVARSFACPAVTAECAAPLVACGGMVVVSEPPASHEERWPQQGLDLLGLVVERRLRAPVGLVALRAVVRCPPRYSRRTGVPAKSPLF